MHLRELLGTFNFQPFMSAYDVTGFMRSAPGRRDEPPRPNRSPNSRPGRHEELARSGIVGLDLRVVHEADPDLIERHRMVHDVDEWDYHPLHALRVRRLDEPASLREPTPA